MKIKLVVLPLILVSRLAAHTEPKTGDLQFEVKPKVVNIYWSPNGDSTLIRMGKIEIVLPNFPHLQQNDVPPEMSLADAEKEFQKEFRGLNEAEKQSYYENRLIFLKGAAQLFNYIKYGVFGLNWMVDSTQVTKQVIKDSSKKFWNFSKDKVTQAWEKILPRQQQNTDIQITSESSLPETHVEILTSSAMPINTHFSTPANHAKTDLIRNTFEALNKIYFRNARLVAEAVEFGLTVGLGVSGNVGFRKTDAAWAIGGLTDLLLHISYRPATETFIINLQSLNELATDSLTKISVVGGIDVRVGAHFKNNHQNSLTKGESWYPSNGVFGTSIYSDRIISWIVTEFNPFILSDLSGFSTQGMAINLLTVEGSKLYPLFFKAGKNSVLGQVLHFVANSMKGENQLNRCEFLF